MTLYASFFSSDSLGNKDPSLETSEYRSEHFYHCSFPIRNKQASYCVDQIVCFATSEGSLLS